ncbi:MAG: T9SS type A sorting domain-containing protein, partial [Actinobacteria bacterium]|nr:T9SS type A sorting domain-containing protein [Actinomycetota bacterium]
IVGNYIASNDLGISVYLRSRPVIKNNVMKTASAVVANMNTQSSIVNNTILFQNIAFSILHESHIDIKNNIIYGSGNGGSLGIRCNESVVTVSYTDFVNILEKYQISHGNGTITEESGVISQNPGFVNIAKGDYRLQESSPCIDAGDPELIYEDIDGTRNDMGAFGGSTPMDPSLTMRLAKSVGISSVSGFPGDTVYTFITVDNPAGLAKAHFIVFYDKSLLTAEPVRLMPTTKDFILSQNVSNAGIIDISLQKSTEIDSGDSKILKLSFIVNKNTISGQACPLEFKNAALFDGDQKAIKIKSISDGAFVVNLGSGIGRYVYVDGKNENNGDGSREHPFRKIQEAINHASVGDTIVVASGDYAEQPTIRKEIYLRGAGASVTSIVVKPDYDAVSFIGVQKGEISGFTIKVSEESYSMGTAISCESSSPVIARNRIEYYMGDLGVICRDNSNPVIEENAVINAGIEIFSSRPVIRKNFIQAYETEGIRCIDSSFAFIVGNKVSSGNYSGLPAVSVINSGATFINNLLYCTEGEGRAVMLSDASNVKIKNCVIADKGNDGIGVDIRNSSDVQIINNTIHAKKKGLAEKSSSTIIENNIISGSQVFGVQVSNTSALSFNDVWGNGTNYDNCLPGENDISDDPLFVDESENDFHLAPGSPCVNAGNPAAQYNDPDGTRNDMGAFGGPDGGSKWMTSAGASLKVPSVNAAYRDTVYLPITGNTIAGVADIDLVLSYDVKTLSFLGANTTDITNGFSLTKTEMTKNMEKLSLSSPTGIKANAGDVVELLFAVKASSDANSYIRFNHASLRDEVSIDRSISKLENGKIIITETGVKDRAKSEPFSFHLFQNYPNPFNSSTTLKFQIPMNAHVSLKIYDILGREVRTLVESYQEAGTHRIVWNGQDNQGIQVTSGVYFIQIKAGKFIQTRKILFVK